MTGGSLPNGQGAEQGAASAGVALVVIVLATYKQLLINGLGLSRGAVSGFVAAVICLLAAFGIVAFVGRVFSRSPGRAPDAGLFAPSLLLAIVWLPLAIRSVVLTKQDVRDVLVSLSYNAFAPILVMYPLAVMTRGTAERLFKWVILLTIPVLGIALAQAVVGPEAMPALLQTDARVFTTMNAAGIERVNGLVGNHIEFGLFAVLVLNSLYATRAKLPGVIVTLLELGWITAILVASSRVFMVLAGGTVAYWRWMRGSTSSRIAVAIGAALVLVLVSRVREYLAIVLLATGNSSALHSTQEHIAMIRVALARMSVHPLVGQGVGSQAGAGKLVTDGWYWAMGLEVGLVGIAAYLAFSVATLQRIARRAIGELRAGIDVGIAQAALIGYAGALAAAVLDSSLGNQANCTLLYLMLGSAALALGPQPVAAPGEVL